VGGLLSLEPIKKAHTHRGHRAFDYGRVWDNDIDSDKWHNSYGGSAFINGFLPSPQMCHYVSDDSRIIFTAGFRFCEISSLILLN
jgi:hypothetical protein